MAPPLYSHVLANVQGSLANGVHFASQTDLEVVDRLLEPQTIAHFLEFCYAGTLPSGKVSSLARLSSDEGERSLIIDSHNNETPIITRVMSRIGSYEDGGRLCIVGKNIESLKSCLWEGITPLSEQRWQEKALDRWDNFDLACQHLSAVTAVFEYLNQPTVMKNLRDTFNLIWDHWAELDRMIAAHRAQSGQQEAGRASVSVTKLWEEFMADQYEVITARAHHWVLSHVERMRAPLVQALRDLPPSWGPPESNPIWWTLTNRFHMLMEISTIADYSIWIPMDGYKGFTVPSPGPGVPTAFHTPNLAQRCKLQSQRIKTLSHSAWFQAAYDRVAQGASHRSSSSSDGYEKCILQIESQKQARVELRGPTPSVETLPKEPWIMRSLLRLDASRPRRPRGYGLAIYRLTYRHTEAEWTAFVRRLEEHIGDWGRGQTGSDAIKPYLKLHWLDGEALGIAEGDIDAAKKQFQTHAIDSFNKEDKVEKMVFLVVDDASVESYMGKAYSAATDIVLAGDFTGFVLAVDAEFDPNETREHAEESPGYQGQMRILGSLIWGDLYARYSSQSALLEDMWPLALEHPNQVYVGPTVPLQVNGWRRQNALRNIMLRHIVEHVTR